LNRSLTSPKLNTKREVVSLVDVTELTGIIKDTYFIILLCFLLCFVFKFGNIKLENHTISVKQQSSNVAFSDKSVIELYQFMGLNDDLSLS